jgi:hypothetical protein
LPRASLTTLSSGKVKCWSGAAALGRQGSTWLGECDGTEPAQRQHPCLCKDLAPGQAVHSAPAEGVIRIGFPRQGKGAARIEMPPLGIASKFSGKKPAEVANRSPVLDPRAAQSAACAKPSRCAATQQRTGEGDPPSLC